MKAFRLLLCTGFALLATAATATEHCPQMGELAEQIMDLRQKEMALSKVIEALAGPSVQARDEYKDLIRSVIIAAYDRPAMRTPANQRNMVDRFRNDIELECYKAGN